MISSMTGFSSHEVISGGYRAVVEMRTLNNRFLDIYVKIPRKYAEMENDIKSHVKEEISRGKVDIIVNIEGVKESVEDVRANIGLIKKYIDAFQTIEKQLKIEIPLNPENILNIDDAFEQTISKEQYEKIKIVVLKAVRGAIKKLKQHKTAEGKNLLEDFKKRITLLAGSVKTIKTIFGERHDEDLQALKDRIHKILDDIEKIDSQRLEFEAALLAEKFDISEECVRLDSHIKIFKSTLSQKGTVGRRLDFILQEMNREANTISSKSNNFDISKEVVRIKEEIDRLKEQIRNVE
ncbi:YicC/YloC family endoribonuclease [candidate division KSB1 bacterium]